MSIFARWSVISDDCIVFLRETTIHYNYIYIRYKTIIYANDDEKSKIFSMQIRNNQLVLC